MPYRLLDVEVDERPRAGEAADTYVRRIAEAKARAALSAIGPNDCVVAADTTVVLDGEILGKPADDARALTMLRALSGNTHRVLTAVCVARGDRREVALAETQVTFQSIPEPLLCQYVATGEPLGKAGAYAIQGLAARFVSRIEGSYSAVVGLPIHETLQLLAQFGCDPWSQPDE